MCMDMIDNRVKKLVAYKQRYGWKVFKADIGDTLYFEYQSYNRSAVVPRGKWITTKKRTCVWVENKQKLHKSTPYPLRFHVYLRRPETIYSHRSYIVVKKVRWSGPVATGYQDGLPVVVANKIKVG